jgi:acyl-CoA thioester hydrolase
MMSPDPIIGPAREPTGGWFEGRIHVFPVRVYYEDTDFSGLVYHANYLRFMERGRSEFLRISGAGHQTILNAQEPLVWAVRRMSIDFARPARMEEALAVHTRVMELVGARMRLDQRVLKDATVLIKAEVEVCIITLDGRPRRVPDPLRKKLEFFLET